MAKTWAWLAIAVLPLPACTSSAHRQPVAVATPSRSDTAASSPAPTTASQPRVVSRRILPSPGPAVASSAAPASGVTASKSAAPVPVAPSAPTAAGAATLPAPTVVAEADAIPRCPSRPLNATCPVMVGSPVDPACTTVWRGRVIAFCDEEAKGRWEANPSAFALNLPLPLVSGSASDVQPWLVAAPVHRVAAPTATAVRATPPAAAPAPADEPPPGVTPSAEGGGGDEECDCADGKCRVPGR